MKGKKRHAPRALMDVDLRVRGRMKRGYTFHSAVPIVEINLPKPWSKARLESNLKLMRKTKATPPVLLHHVRGRYEIEDGIHRINAAKRLGFSHIPAVIALEREP